jgi:opacity protein-like surface antigen
MKTKKSQCRRQGILWTLAAVFQFAALPAGAEDGFIRAERSYFEARVGAPFPTKVPVGVRNSAGPMFSGLQRHGGGPAGIAALMLGKYLSRHIRIEAELSHGRWYDPNIELASGFAGNPNAGKKVNGTGSIFSYALTGAIFYDFDMPGTRLTPYLGVGGGIALMQARSVGPKPGIYRMSDTAWLNPWCLMAGFDYWLTGNMALTARYTGILMPNVKMKTRSQGAILRTNMKGGYRDGVTIGVRIMLN